MKHILCSRNSRFLVAAVSAARCGLSSAPPWTTLCARPIRLGAAAMIEARRDVLPRLRGSLDPYNQIVVSYRREKLFPIRSSTPHLDEKNEEEQGNGNSADQMGSPRCRRIDRSARDRLRRKPDHVGAG